MYKKNIFLGLALIILFAACASNNDLTIVEKNGKYGVLKNNGKQIIENSYEQVNNFTDINDKNIKEQHLHPINFHWLSNYSGERYSIIKKNGKYGIISSKNEILLNPEYDFFSKEYNNYFLVKKDGKYGILNKHFKIIKKPVYKNIINESNILFVQSFSNDKWSCLLKNNAVLKEKNSFDEIYPFVNGFARFVNDKKWGFIDKKCNVITKKTYSYAFDFSNNYAKVIEHNKTLFIDEKGKEISKTLFSSGQSF